MQAPQLSSASHTTYEVSPSKEKYTAGRAQSLGSIRYVRPVERECRRLARTESPCASRSRRTRLRGKVADSYPLLAPKRLRPPEPFAILAGASIARGGARPRLLLSSADSSSLAAGSSRERIQGTRCSGFPAERAVQLTGASVVLDPPLRTLRPRDRPRRYRQVNEKFQTDIEA